MFGKRLNQKVKKPQINYKVPPHPHPRKKERYFYSSAPQFNLSVRPSGPPNIFVEDLIKILQAK